MKKQKQSVNPDEVREIYCPKHTGKLVRFICSKKSCEFGNMICDNCLQAEPIHPNQHKNYLFQVPDFLEVQTQMQQKFIPSLGSQFQEIERRYKLLEEYCNNEVKEIDKDFASLFKEFFTISENTKTFLKDRIKRDQRKFGKQLKEIKKGFQELAQPKNQKNFFQLIFSSNSDEVKANTPQELVQKLAERNGPLNEMRSSCIALGQELESLIENRVTYRKNEQSVNLFQSIQDDFQITIKDMYRRLKGLVEGGNPEDLRKSIFDYQDQSMLDQTINSNLDQSRYSSTKSTASRRNPMTVKIDLSSSMISMESSQSQQNLHSSRVIDMENFEKEMKKPPQINLKKLKHFPAFKNNNVIQAIQKYGSLDINMMNSPFNNIPDQGPFEYDDKSVYYGHYQNNKRHGRGRCLFSDGSFYEGYWKLDEPFGYGRLIKGNGDTYEGICNNFTANGQGKFEKLDNSYIYKGDWVNDVKQGSGDEKVLGQYEYKGKFNNGIFHGQGELKLQDGSKYSGDFYEGQMTGQGTFDYPNGDKYLGQVENGKKQGKGIFVWADKRQYEGQFNNDLIEGEGIYIWPDGYIYNGAWEKGEQHGQGTEIDPDGNEKLGVWQNGEWVQWIQAQ